jgi:membrane associated rhomboid family serine protease
MARIYNVSSGQRDSFFGRLSVNTILILMNVVLFFVFTIMISYNLFSIDAIAIKPANILAGNYFWTFLTSMFMHGGFFHLFANMFSLLFIGSLVEKILGRKRYFWFYMMAGLFAGLFFVLISAIPLSFFSTDFNAFAVGSSGAIFGLIGSLMLLTPNLPVYLMFIPIPIKMKYAAPGMLVLLWLISAAGNVSIGNTAHLGGLIAGLIYGIYLKNKYKNKTRIISKHFS